MPDSNETTVYNEAQYQQIFAHRCVPRVFGINNTKKPYSLFMEFFGKDLQSLTIHKLLYDKQFMDIMGSMTVPYWFRVCYDIADALQYIHEKGFLHCDIKINNVLVSHHKNGYLIEFGKLGQTNCICIRKEICKGLQLYCPRIVIHQVLQVTCIRLESL